MRECPRIARNLTAGSVSVKAWESEWVKGERVESALLPEPEASQAWLVEGMCGWFRSPRRNLPILERAWHFPSLRRIVKRSGLSSFQRRVPGLGGRYPICVESLRCWRSRTGAAVWALERSLPQAASRRLGFRWWRVSCHHSNCCFFLPEEYLRQRRPRGPMSGQRSSEASCGVFLHPAIPRSGRKRNCIFSSGRKLRAQAGGMPWGDHPRG